MKNSRNYSKVDLSTWNRKETFDFYRTYADPFFELTAQVKITNLYKSCKEKEEPLFLAYLFETLKVVNSIEEFKMRIINGELIKFDTINGGSTILNNNKSFSFCYFDYTENRAEFILESSRRIEEVKIKKGMTTREGESNMIHCSTLPWVSFTSIKHAKQNRQDDCIPKIVFGKYQTDFNGELIMPISIELNHAIADGYHVGLFFEKLEMAFQNCN